MGRNTKAGIYFYKMDCGHIRNKKIRLLFNEFDSDGYWIWKCLLDYGYEKWGYFFDLNDKEELELFATDHCRKKVGLIQEVIAGCLRRGLFDRAVYELSGVLTCTHMQEVFVFATKERRKKGFAFTMIEEWILIDLSKDKTGNIAILPANLELLPGKKGENPGTIPQTKLNINETVNETDSAQATPAPEGKKKKTGKKREKDPEPFWQELVDVWFSFNVEKFGDKPSFKNREPKILQEIVEQLKKRAAAQAAPWDGISSVSRFRAFLDKAFLDPWLSKNFLLPTIEKQFDKIILNQSINGSNTNGGTHSNGHQGTSGQRIEALKKW